MRSISEYGFTFSSPKAEKKWYPPNTDTRCLEENYHLTGMGLGIHPKQIWNWLFGWSMDQGFLILPSGHFVWSLLGYRFPLPKNIETTTLPPPKNAKTAPSKLPSALACLFNCDLWQLSKSACWRESGGFCKKHPPWSHTWWSLPSTQKILCNTKAKWFQRKREGNSQEYLPQCITSWWFQPIWFFFSQIGSFPPLGVRIKNVWNHHLDHLVPA